MSGKLVGYPETVAKEAEAQLDTDVVCHVAFKFFSVRDSIT